MFLFIEYNNQQKSVEIVRTGTFTDSHGKQVTITQDDLAAMVANFDEGEAGQDIPFDIDHNYGEAAGWLKRIWIEGDRLMGEPEWNDKGRELIGKRIYRYLSAAIDMARKVLKSISLVNFPAVKGLAALELAEGILTYQEEEGIAMPDNNVVNVVDGEALREQIRAELMAEFEAQETRTAELRRQVETEVRAELEAKYARRKGLQEFASELCGGDAGLSAKPEDVVEFLEGLDEGQVERAKALLGAKVVSFTEAGSAGKGQDETGELLELPEEFAAELRAGTLELSDLRNPILGLENLDRYDLSEFKGE